jgi:hypothetical protein
MTLYRLYLRSHVRREPLPPGQVRPEAAWFVSSLEGQTDQLSMISDGQRYTYMITGCEDFAAENDAAALAIARSIFDAATDFCDAFELWDGTRHIDQSRVTTLETRAVIAQRQEHVIRVEEALLNSGWAIARSRRLLARFNEISAETASHRPATRGLDPGHG